MSAGAQGQLLLGYPWSASSRAVQVEAANWEMGDSGGGVKGPSDWDGGGRSAAKSISGEEGMAAVRASP